MRARGANLDVVEDVVTGLPVADMDHGMRFSIVAIANLQEAM